MLGAAAAAWLPEASRRVSAGMVSHEVPLGCIVMGLRWLPLLTCYGGPMEAPSAAAAATSDSGTPGAGVEVGSTGGSWASFVEAAFPPRQFLRNTLNTWSNAMDASGRGSMAPRLAEAACTFAALCPEEAAAGAGPGLKIEQVRALAAELKALEQPAAADAAEALAAQLLRWERGGGARGGGRGGGRSGGRAAAAASGPPLAARYGVWVPLLQSAAALLPASPAAARQLLGGCSNPACADLEGDSDAALPLRACAGCGGAASYCSRECQMAHWRSGHREACGGGAGGGGRGGGEPSRRLQLGWHTALGLTMRAARMGVRAAEEAAAGRTREQEVAALTAALEGRGTLRVLLGEELAAAVAGEALAVTAQLRALLPAASEADATAGAHADPTSDAGSCGPGQVDQGAEWWRLMTRLAPHLGTTLVMDLFPAQSFGDCLRMHLPRMPGSAEPLPPIPPPALASALAGGVLPCLERLVRRAATAAPGDTGTGQVTPELVMLMSFEEARRSLVDSTDVTWGWLPPMLAYGDPREAGALIASLGKALAGFDSVSPGLNALMVDFTSNLCTVAPTWLDAAAARLERGGALTPPERQLAGLLGAAAVAWLPELSRRIWSGPFMTQAGSVDCVMPLGCVSAGVRWLPLLSCAAAPAARDAAAAAASSGPEAPATNVAATSSGGGGAGGGWRSFAEALFPRQAFISLAVDIQQRANSDDGSRQALAPWTAEAACTFAALRPKEAAAGVGTVLRTEQVRALATELRAGGQAEAADAAEALAAQLLRWERGGGARGGGRGGGRSGGRAAAAASGPPLAARYGVWVPLLQSAAALLPASPAAARQLLGGCSNPACANLEGDSDAALPLRACAGCGGAASYCSRECQMAHWRSGHREACGGGAGGGGRGGG
ncbi:hypothetical protein HYH03_019163 [Edaphochlamys debaryana]|uniref:phytol kinase n=1 Tax=Edaphochlamys debaryana TaxID=47281 RepID=A0A835XDB7_9CHLO|nr:hypothetical protein HYH03_019163 [Edaphochlamys debaryana]|eukprot:KAG2481878.1 hypothetical protein HYH03_019163 [Edaphochlamys debaryana]